MLTSTCLIVFQVAGCSQVLRSISAVFLIVVVFSSSPRGSSFRVVRLFQGVFQVKHANIRTRFWVRGCARGVAVEDSRKGHRDVGRAFETRLAVTFSEDTDLSDKVKWFRRSGRHAASENALLIRADHGSML